MRRIDNPRLLAFEVLVEVECDEAFSNLLLPKFLSISQMSRSDKALASELVYGSLRLKGRHDLFIGHVSDRPLEEIDVKLLIVLRLGVHQLKEMRIPSHAAINESVELAKRVVGKSASSFANALLRKIDNISFDDLAKSSDTVSALSRKHSHPEWIVSSYLDSLKSESEVEQLLAANNSAAAPTLIAWPGRSSVDELSEYGATPVVGSNVAATALGDPGDIPAIKERRAGVQDLGSQKVVEVLFETFQPQLRWLDLCAGPGGKAAYLDALLAQSGAEFVANEISAERAKLVQQVVRHGKVVNHDGRNLPENLGKFDRILLDAPCTGLGALRRRPEVRWRRTLQDLRNLTKLQEELLNAAAQRLNPDGVIAYVTCSPHQAETEFQVRSFLRKNSDFSLEPISAEGVKKVQTLQLWTHRDGCDAMFMALLKRNGESNDSNLPQYS